jgi:hypothetical protein
MIDPLSPCYTKKIGHDLDFWEAYISYVMLKYMFTMSHNGALDRGVEADQRGVHGEWVSSPTPMVCRRLCGEKAL